MATEPIEPVSIAMPENIMDEILEKCDSLSIQTQKKTDPIPPELMAMPEDVLIIILEKCDFVSIQRLRSTCRAFQNLIDRKKPSYHFKYIKIQGNQKKMSLEFSEKDESEEWYPNGPKIYMVYQKIDEECTKIHWIREDEDRTKIISNFNFFNLFSRDLGPILDRNSATLDKMLIDLPVFEDREMYFERVFESCRKPPIKVHTLLIAFATCQEDVLGILPYTCPDTLKILKIAGPGRRCDISRILQLDHWKKLEEVVMRRMSVRAGIQNYDHFEDAVISLEQVTRDDAIRVKENFLNSPSTTKYLQIYFNRFPDQDLLIESFGQFYPEPDDGVQRALHKSWFFRRPDDYVVFLVVEYYEFLKCEIKTLTDVPEGARVIG